MTFAKFCRSARVVQTTLACLLLAPACGQAQTVEWVRQLGSSYSDFSLSVSADRTGSVYISGYTSGSLGGLNPAGLNEDAFVSKYNAAGRLEWTRQLGSSSLDNSNGVSADGLGNVYISGVTTGSLNGQTTARGYDAFVSKYDEAGRLEWTRQLGSSFANASYGVSADGLGNVYISGYTTGSLSGQTPAGGYVDAFVSKYDEAGGLEWTRQLGSSSQDESNSVSADSLANVYISGVTYGSLSSPNAGSTDAFVSKYDSAGSLEWTRQLGSSLRDESVGVSADGLGNVYITGYTDGSLGGQTSAGGFDAFVSKYDSAGSLEWTRQLGSGFTDGSYGVSADGLGNVYISGQTDGNLGGQSTAGSTDAFVSKYDTDGRLEWTRQLGSRSFDTSRGVSADGLGNVYLSGYTTGNPGGFHAGGFDAFVAKIVVPEPAGFVLVGLPFVGTALIGWRRR